VRLSRKTPIAPFKKKNQNIIILKIHVYVYINKLFSRNIAACVRFHLQILFMKYFDK